MSNCQITDSRLKCNNLIKTLLISFTYLVSFGQDTYFYYFTSIQRKNKWTQIIINSLKHRHSDKEIKLVEQKISISLILQIIQIDGDANCPWPYNLTIPYTVRVSEIIHLYC